MTNLLAFPVRILSNGAAATLEDGTIEYYGAEIACMIQTDPGERTLAPAYGIPNLMYDVEPINTLGAQLEMYGPPVDLQDVLTEQVDENEVSVTVAFDLIDEDSFGNALDTGDFEGTD